MADEPVQTQSNLTPDSPQTPRKRGRPRKNPQTPAPTASDDTLSRVAGISIAVPPQRKKYLIGQVEIDLSGGMLDVMYEDGTVRRIPMTKDMSAEPKSLDVGRTEVLITCFGCVATFPIEILEPRALQLTIVSAPRKLEYEDGDKLDLSGLVIQVLFNDDVIRSVNDLSVDYHVSYGDESISLTYMGLSFSIPIHVKRRQKAVEPYSLEIFQMPDKTEYVVGDREFDPAGGQLMLQLSNGRREFIPLGDATLKGFHTDKAGEIEMTAGARGLECKFKLNIIHQSLVGIEIASYPKSEYAVGETYTLAGFLLNAIYNNGDREAVADYTVDKTKASEGDTEIIVSYQGYTASIPVHVRTTKISAIRLISLPAKLDYIQGEKRVSAEGGVMEVKYETGDIKNLPLKSSYISGYRSEVCGKQTLTVTYRGCVTTFDIFVRELEIVGIEIAETPRTEYEEGEIFDRTGLAVNAIYLNGSKRDITGEVQIRPNGPLKPENQLVIVMYGKMAAVLPVNVREKPEEESAEKRERASNGENERGISEKRGQAFNEKSNGEVSETQGDAFKEEAGQGSAEKRDLAFNGRDDEFAPEKRGDAIKREPGQGRVEKLTPSKRNDRPASGTQADGLTGDQPAWENDEGDPEEPASAGKADRGMEEESDPALMGEGIPDDALSPGRGHTANASDDPGGRMIEEPVMTPEQETNNWRIPEEERESHAGNTNSTWSNANGFTRDDPGAPETNTGNETGGTGDAGITNDSKDSVMIGFSGIPLKQRYSDRCLWIEKEWKFMPFYPSSFDLRFTGEDSSSD